MNDKKHLRLTAALVLVLLAAVSPVIPRNAGKETALDAAEPAEVLTAAAGAARARAVKPTRKPVFRSLATFLSRASGEATGEASSEVQDRLTISILGDSNSAYHGWSDDAAADTTNSTIRGSRVYFEESDLPAESMWWYLAAQTLGAEILVNNSWTGSCVYLDNEPYAGIGTEGWGSRCVNLHDDTGENAGEEPDIILIFLGTCDCTFHYETIGRAGTVDHDSLIRELESGVYYDWPTNSAEAYAIMLDRITRRYPDALVCCMTVLPRRDASIYQRYFVEQMNSIIITEAAYFGAAVADVYRDSGITSEIDVFDRYMMDLLHPNEEGMERIAAVVVDALRSAAPELLPESAEDAVQTKDGVTILLQAAELS